MFPSRVQHNHRQHPRPVAVAGLGLGKRLIRRVCQSVFGLSIGDVAVMAPEHLEGFFEVAQTTQAGLLGVV